MPVKLIKRAGWSEAVAKRLDRARPKYSEAVKSLAAFARTQSVFELLVSRLDAACNEAEDHAR